MQIVNKALNRILHLPHCFWPNEGLHLWSLLEFSTRIILPI